MVVSIASHGSSDLERAPSRSLPCLLVLTCHLFHASDADEMVDDILKCEFLLYMALRLFLLAIIVNTNYNMAYLI